MAAAHLVHCHARPVHVFVFVLATYRLVVGLPTSSNTGDQLSRQQIRLAMLHPDPSDVVEQFVLRHFDVPNRTLLPDYDVVVHHYRARRGESVHQLIAVLAEDTPTYHALLGPWCREDAEDLIHLAPRARLFQVHGGNNIAFRDRTTYPYHFRAVRSMQGVQTTFFEIAMRNEWYSIISLWGVQDFVDGSTALAASLNMTNFPTLVEPVASAWAVSAWQDNIINLVRSFRVRIVIIFIGLEQGWQLICRVHRAKLSGIQYFTEDTWSPGWQVANYPPQWGDCTADEMYIAGRGSVTIVHTPVAPGVNMFGVLPFPPAGGDQSQLPLTCMPGLTASDFYNSGELYFVMSMAGLITDPGRAFAAISGAGLFADSICAALLALHDSLYTQNVSLSSIEQRDMSAYLALTESMSKVDFQGPPGRFRFYDNSGDPEYMYYVLRQDALPGRVNGSTAFTGIVTFPNGRDQPPLIDLVDEENLPLVWVDDSRGLGPKPHLGLFPDCALVNGLLVWDTCLLCLPGTFFDKLLEDCGLCPEGQFQNESGMSGCKMSPEGWHVVDVQDPSAIVRCPAGHECPKGGIVIPMACPEGRFASSRGQSVCQLCPVGSFQDGKGSTECITCPAGHECVQSGTLSPQPCAKGRFAALSGQSACELCPEGQYQDGVGSRRCKPCETNLTGGITANIASTSIGQCICPQGTFRPSSGDFCRSCLEGMRCPEGSDMRNLPMPATSSSVSESLPFPLVKRGYMTIPSEPLIVYRCKQEEHCPGGAPGSCASRRDMWTVACGNCVSGAYESGEACEDCGTAGALPLIASGVLVVAFVVVATLVINKDIHKTPAASMMIVGVTSLLFTSLQAMGVFSTVEVPWKEPIKRMLELSKVLSFDFDLLKVACVLGEQPLRSFAFRQLVAVVMVPFVAVALLLKKYIFGKRRTDILVELCNSIGTIYSVFFISSVISAVDPFMCYDHPNGNGESVQSAPSMLCFQGGGNHAAMVAIGLVGVLLVPLPFMCFCAYGIWTYPRMIKKHSSSRFLHATRFLFLRFVPHRYYFQLVVLARSVLMCLIPAALRGEAASQIILISMVLGGYEVLVYSLLPWRVVHCNHLDAVLTQLLVLFLLCGGIFIKETPQESTVGVLNMVVFIGIITSVTIALAYAVRQRLAPPCYQFFICHHKAHAAAQSRYLKILLKKRRSNTRVFIDSDNLQELDSLFDVVKSRVKHLLVLLTADTLKRPWCVGEIVTALKGGLQVTRLETPSFVVPTEEQQASADAYVDSTGCNLSEYGIQWADVTDALAAFLGSAAAQLRLSEVLPGTRRFEHAVASLLKQRNDDQTKVKLLSNVGVGSVLVVTNPESDEANASGGILVDHIAAEVYRICEQGLVLLCDYDHDLDSSLRVAGQSSVAVVILSEGCLQSVTHLGIICHLMQAQVRESSSAIISVNTPGFGFPTLAAIDQACKASPTLKASYGDNATQYVSSFFKRISIYLPTHAGQHALAAQSEEILCRIQDCLANKLGKAFRQTSQESSSRHVLEAESKRSGAPISSSSPTTDSHTTDLHNQKKKADTPPVRASRYTWTLEFPAEDISEKDF